MMAEGLTQLGETIIHHDHEPHVESGKCKADIEKANMRKLAKLEICGRPLQTKDYS